MINIVDCDDNKDEDGYLERNLCPSARISDKCQSQASEMLACVDVEGHPPRVFKNSRRTLATQVIRGANFRSRSPSPNSLRNSSSTLPVCPPADEGVCVSYSFFQDQK